jgi:hypothetical protein
MNFRPKLSITNNKFIKKTFLVVMLILAMVLGGLSGSIFNIVNKYFRTAFADNILSTGYGCGTFGQFEPNYGNACTSTSSVSSSSSVSVSSNSSTISTSSSSISSSSSTTISSSTQTSSFSSESAIFSSTSSQVSLVSRSSSSNNSNQISSFSSSILSSILSSSSVISTSNISSQSSSSVAPIQPRGGGSILIIGNPSSQNTNISSSASNQDFASSKTNLSSGIETTGTQNENSTVPDKNISNEKKVGKVNTIEQFVRQDSEPTVRTGGELTNYFYILSLIILILITLIVFRRNKKLQFGYGSKKCK